MVSWSSLTNPALAAYQNILKAPVCRNAIQLQLRKMSGGHEHHQMHIQPSRFQWNKFKDLVHFYTMLGLIPVTAVVLYANIFIGPAQLHEIPAGYEPKHWEYHKHPISRFISRYMFPSPQQNYEKHLHHLYEESEKMHLRSLEKKIRAKMSERNDYQAYYYRPLLAKYYRISKESADELKELRGDN